MRKQDHLLGLIASLNANEKRHFRLFAAQQQDDTNYLKLFDALEGKEQYNAADLRRTLNWSATQLDKQKSYLAKVLLKSLRIYKDGISFTAEMTNYLLEIEELMGRRLFDYALELIDKALARAEKKDFQYLVPAFLYFKLDILILTGKYEDLQQVDDRMQAVQFVNAQQHSIHTMLARVQQFEQSGKAPEHFAYHKHPLLKIKPEDIISKRSLIGWFTMMNFYQVVTKMSPEKAVLLVRKQVEMYETDKSLRTVSAMQYIYSYQWLAIAEGEAGNHKAAWQASETLLEIINSYKKTLKPGTINGLLDNVQVIRIRLLFLMGKYEESRALAAKVEAEALVPDLQTQFASTFGQALGLLHTGNSADAVVKLDELSQMQQDIRTDMQPYIRPLMILAQLQMDNHQVVLYLIKSTRAWMKRHKIDNPEIESFLSHTYAIANAPVATRKAQWQKLKASAAKSGMDKLNKEMHLNHWLKEFAR